MAENNTSKLNTGLISIVIAAAGFIGVMVVQHGQAIAGIASTMAELTRTLDEIRPLSADAAVLKARVDQQGQRSDQIEQHLDATDKRVDRLEVIVPRKSPGQ